MIRDPKKDMDVRFFTRIYLPYWVSLFLWNVPILILLIMWFWVGTNGQSKPKSAIDYNIK